MVRGFCLVFLCFDFLLQIWVLLEIFLLDRFAHLFSLVSFTSLCQNFATFCDCSNLVTIDCCFRYPWHQHFPPKLTKQPKSAASWRQSQWMKACQWSRCYTATWAKPCDAWEEWLGKARSRLDGSCIHEMVMFDGLRMVRTCSNDRKLGEVS